MVMGSATPVAPEVYGPMYAITWGSLAASVAFALSILGDHSPFSPEPPSSLICSTGKLPEGVPRSEIARSIACAISLLS